MTFRRNLLVALFLILACQTAAWAQAPAVLTSRPGDGEANVAVDLGKISIFFTQPMNTGSWSLLPVEGRKYPPIIMDSSPWHSAQEFVLTLGALEPGQKYGLQLNNDEKKGFKAADGGAPLAPTRILFETKGGGNAAPAKAPAGGVQQTGGEPPRGGDGVSKEEEQVGTQITGAVLAILFHEFGHCLVDIYQLPITGREEDAVDEFSTLLLLDSKEEGVENVGGLVSGVAQFFYLMSKTGGQTPWWDEHSADMVRFGNIVCYLYGSSPEEFQGVMDRYKVSKKRQHFCKEDYPKRLEAWKKLLKDHLRANGAEGPGKMTVAYGEVKSDWAKELDKTFRENRFFELIAEGITKEFALPFDITLKISEGDEPNAYWDSQDRTIAFTYSLIKFYVDLMAREAQAQGEGGQAGGGGQAGPVGGGQAAPAPVIDQAVVGSWAGYVTQGVISFVLKCNLGADGHYTSRGEMWAQNNMFAAEEEAGVYEARGGRIAFKVLQSSQTTGVGSVATLTYQIQGQYLVLTGVPAINGMPIYLQRTQ